jgi:hypothetical protein
MDLSILKVSDPIKTWQSQKADFAPVWALLDDSMIY